MKATSLIILILLSFMSCDKKTQDTDSSTFYEVPPNKTILPNDIKINNITTDTISIDTNIETSFAGQFSIFNNKIYFFDEVFGYTYRFTKKGALIDRNMGKGRGPNEIPRFDYAIVSENAHYFLNAGNSTVSLYDNSFKKEKDFTINNPKERPVKEVMENPMSSMFDAYEFDYGIPNAFQLWDKEHFAISITASHPKFNGYFNSDLYYNHSRILAIVNINSGNIIDLIGRRSPFYLSHQNLPNFDHFNYQINQNEVYISFWADGIIYVLDKKSGLAVNKFGVEGRDMQTDYMTTLTYEAAERNWRKDMENYGYYNYLKYLPNKQLLFRGYSKGNDALMDGLQIYKDYKLIGDIDVFKGLEIIGEIDDYIYAVNSKSQSNNLEVYKLKLDYEN